MTFNTTPNQYQGPQPASTPFPKIVYGGIVNAFGNNILGIRRASFVAQAGTTDQAIIAPNGSCGSGVATPTSFVLAFGTQQKLDSYGLTILGGPGEPAPGNIFTQNVGPSATSIIMGFKTTKGAGGRKLPWLSKVYAGNGIQGGKGTTGVGSPPAYGKFPIPDPANPGSYIAAPSGGTTADPIVNAPEIEVELAYDADPALGGTNISNLQFGGYNTNGLMVNPAALSGGGGGSGAIVAFTTYDVSGTIAASATSGSGTYLHFNSWIDIDQGGWVTAGTDGSTGNIIVPKDGYYALDFSTHCATSSTIAQGYGYNITLGVAWDDPLGSTDDRQMPVYFDQPRAGVEVVDIGETSLVPVVVFLHAGTTVNFFARDQAGAGIEYSIGYIAIWKIGGGGGGATGHQAKAHAGTVGNSAAAGNWLGDNNPGLGSTTNVSGANYLDTLDWDTDSYWDSGDGYFVIPTGLGGTYLLTMKVSLSLTVDTGSGNKGWNASLTDFNAASHENDNFTANANSNGSGSFTAGVNEYVLKFTRTAQLADGDQVIPQVDIGAFWAMTSNYADCSLVKLS